MTDLFQTLLFMNWIDTIIGLLGGGGITTVIIALINKRKSPYDMLMELLNEQKRWMAQKEEELADERRDSAEKSYIIARSRLCEARRNDPSLECPVDKANDIRLQNKCSTCPANRSSES